MYRPDKLIIDNTDLKLFDELNKILKEQKNLDIATAYFNIAGFELIQNSLKNIERLRLLIGIAPQRDSLKQDLFSPEQIYKNSLREDIEKEEFSKIKEESVKNLLNLLRQENVEVKIYTQGFLHGKAYIFDKIAIIGSSNFTYSGFTSNTELNAVLDEAHSQYIRKNWFENLWNQAKEFKQEFINIFDESKFGTKEYSPFAIFIKSLYELQKEDILFSIDTPDTLPPSEVDLANFQEDAVKRIYSRLKSYNGVLIADAVGLGKTWIAKKVIEDFGFYRRKRFVVVCPASIDELLWRPALKDIGISENIIHHEELGKENLNFNELERKLGFKLEEISLIVIDESHNFRNPLSNRYENLFSLIEKANKKHRAKVMLLTATPMNNSHWDLYFQLMLIAQNNKRIFYKEGIADLEKRFKQADKGDINQLSDILQIISIRRTRQYIKQNYPDAKFKDAEGNWIKIKFPERKLFEVNYSLDKTYQGLYYKIASKIEKDLKLAYYRLEDYKIVGEKDKMELGRMEALGGILQTLLLKRLESSVYAFKRSIQTQIDFLSAFKEIFKQGKILRKKFYNKYIDYLNNELENNNEILDKLKENLEEINLNNYDTEKFLKDLDDDINIFKEIKKLVEPIDYKKDAKLKELKRKLIQLKDTGKILLFSFYADTINYLYEALTTDKEFSNQFGKNIEKITGSYSTKKRKEVIDQFLNSDVDLLLSTDILSEGQNLQKASICINYDLHWNPVRMIQRAGRIDRIGSPFDEIYIYNFFPEQELESLLELVKKLQYKIEIINESIGLDASVLGETIKPKVFGIIKDLKGTEEQKEKVLKELEEEQFGGGELFWQPLKDFGLEKLKEFCDSIPYGVQSGLKKNKNFKGIFFYYKYGEDFHLWYLYDAINDRFITSKTEILNFISCNKDEPRFIPDDLDIFAIHKKVREQIKEFFSENLITTKIRTPTGRMEKTLRDLRDELEYIKDELLEEKDYIDKIDFIIPQLHQISFTKKRMQYIRKIWRNYKLNKNWYSLILQLYKFLKEKSPVEQEKIIEEFDEEKLKLICVQYIS